LGRQSRSRIPDGVLNQKAASFYRRHGVLDIEPAAESGLDLTGHTVMTTRYCLKYELGLCPRESTEKKKESTEKQPRIHAPETTSSPSSVLSSSSVPSTPPPEPWFITDDEGRHLHLRFRCADRHCVMEIVYKG
jgi:hypothetical protein